MNNLLNSRLAVKSLLDQFRAEDKHPDYMLGYISEVLSQVLVDLNDEKREDWIRTITRNQEAK